MGIEHLECEDLDQIFMETFLKLLNLDKNLPNARLDYPIGFPFFNCDSAKS